MARAWAFASEPGTAARPGASSSALLVCVLIYDVLAVMIITRPASEGHDVG